MKMVCVLYHIHLPSYTPNTYISWSFVVGARSTSAPKVLPDEMGNRCNADPKHWRYASIAHVVPLKHLSQNIPDEYIHVIFYHLFAAATLLVTQTQVIIFIKLCAQLVCSFQCIFSTFQQKPQAHHDCTSVKIQEKKQGIGEAQLHVDSSSGLREEVFTNFPAGRKYWTNSL